MVRNFWINALIDGRQTTLSGGPQSRNGGMDINIFQRNEGEIVTAVRIKCIAEKDGRLATEIYTWEPRTDDEVRVATLIGGRVTRR